MYNHRDKPQAYSIYGPTVWALTRRKYNVTSGRKILNLLFYAFRERLHPASPRSELLRTRKKEIQIHHRIYKPNYRQGAYSLPSSPTPTDPASSFLPLLPNRKCLYCRNDWLGDMSVDDVIPSLKRTIYESIMELERWGGNNSR